MIAGGSACATKTIQQLAAKLGQAVRLPNGISTNS
jgi:hypothetical protein